MKDVYAESRWYILYTYFHSGEEITSAKLPEPRTDISWGEFFSV